MRLSVAFLAAGLFLVSNVEAQSPNNGRIQNGAYVNPYFHISYRWPKILQPYDTASLRLPQKSANESEFLLFSAKQGDQQDGVVLIAMKLNVPTAHSNGIKDAADMMDRIMHFDPEQHVTLISKRHFAGAKGLVFDELDYLESGAYSSAMITTVGNYLLVFKCNGESAADLEAMTTSIAALQKTN